MKKLFVKFGVTSLLPVLFLLAGLFFCTTSATAQTVTGSQQTGGFKTNKQWLSVDLAKQALQSSLDAKNGSLGAGTAGNAVKVKVQVSMYNAVMTALQNNASVPDAAFQGYNQFAPGPGVDVQPVPGITGSDWSAMYNELIGLLTQ
jgi:hypothetical protein